MPDALAAASVLTIPATVAGSLRRMLHVDASSMLVHADHGGIDHLGNRILLSGERILREGSRHGARSANEAV